MTTPAGWYADPDDASQQRYWDGSTWTEHRAPAAAPGPAPGPAYGTPPPAYGGGYAPAPYAGAPAYGAPLPPVLVNAQLAEFWPRVGAALLDGVFAVFTLGIGFIVNFFLMAREGEKNGMTWGKQVVGLRVVKEDGQPVDIGLALMRDFVIEGLLIGVVGSFLCGIPALLDVLWPLWDERNQTLHDKIVSTYVVTA